MDVHEEDPVEAYKREFQRKRWEKEQAAKARRLRGEQQAHRIARFLTFPIAVFAIILLLDKYLPRDVYHEVAELGWQERGSGKHPELYSYMQTKSFTFVVPHEAHLDYPYYDANKPVITIKVTPIFKIPLQASFTLSEYFYSFDLTDNIHMLIIPLTWLLFVSSMFTILMKEYSKLSYSLCFLPMLLLAFTLLKLLY